MPPAAGSALRLLFYHRCFSPDSHLPLPDSSNSHFRVSSYVRPSSTSPSPFFAFVFVLVLLLTAIYKRLQYSPFPISSAPSPTAAPFSPQPFSSPASSRCSVLHTNKLPSECLRSELFRRPGLSRYVVGIVLIFVDTVLRPAQTERTHEENQERAYIAASRRSDRSLEARVESARRASEIHKRRTGRSLRVTEQDVINEEMYEEEDDDLPSQYRRLTAHLQTNSNAFNQRLAAYLTGQIGVRSAVDQYISNSYAQQFPNAQQFPQNQPMYQNPAMAQQFHQQIMQQSSSPTSMYRQAPYPMPSLHQRQAALHARSASIANPQMGSQKTQSPVLPNDEKRRMSLATAPTTATGSPDLSRTPISNTSSTPKTIPATPQTGVSQQQPLQPFQSLYNNSSLNPDFSFFSTALPAESQMLLGSALDPRDPMTNMFMAGSQYMPNSYYNFDATLPPTLTVGKDVSGGQLYPSFDGLNTTLAPSELEMNPGLDFEYAGQTSFFDAGMKETTAGGTATPGGNDFNLFIDQEAWGETPQSSQS